MFCFVLCVAAYGLEVPCYHPIHGFQRPDGRFTMERWGKGGENNSLTIPCRQCVGCRLERSRQWAVRCVHEASLYGDNNVFVTLTYSPEHLPQDGSLDYRHFQLFMKRLRKKFGCGVRFYMCGEYGDDHGRPHYHALLFNCDFPDKYPWRKTPTGFTQYRSNILDELWGKGHCEIGAVSFKSAAYVARYIMKKVTGDAAAFHYADIDIETGQVLREVKPEFNNMSRRPGIGAGWIDKYLSDVYPHDFVVINGKRQRPPRYYDKFFNLTDPLSFEEVQFDRHLEMQKRSDDMTVERLAVRERVAQANLERLVRPLD